jgi:hypothetical protein
MANMSSDLGVPGPSEVYLFRYLFLIYYFLRLINN